MESRPINLRLIHMKIQAKNIIENYSHYRGICLQSQPSKVFERMPVQEKRISYIVEPQLSDNQFGFRKNKGCSDGHAILILTSTTIISILIARNHFMWPASIKSKHSSEY